MNKLCQPSPPARRNRVSKQLALKTHTCESVRLEEKTSKLEEKLDGLVALLTSATQGVPGIINVSPVTLCPEGLVPANHEDVVSSTVINRVGCEDYTHNKPSPNTSGILKSNYTPTASSSSISTPLDSLRLQPDLPSAFEFSPEDAELCLNRFRTVYIKYLPFIIIPPSVTSQQLRQDRPLLWSSIMTVASSNSAHQTSLSRGMRGIFGREALVEGTRNMDLLLAILVYATW